MMKYFAMAVLVLCFTGCLSLAVGETPSGSVPVFVELFTAEGCSSCPPADVLLQKLDAQPLPSVQLIVLSEHVDYWNQGGWKDPYSSAFFSQRQSTYAKLMRIDSVYTPQMVVDGTREFVGSDISAAQKAIEESRNREKIPVDLGVVSLANGVLHARLEIGSLPDSLHVRSADVYAALALNHAESQVLRGENEGRRLQHVAVVRSITKVGTVGRNKNLAEDTSIKLAGIEPANLRVVVFVQDSASGRVLGAVMRELKK